MRVHQFFGITVGLGCLLVLTIWASGQVTIPEKGWKLVAEGDGVMKGKRFLGVWQNEEKTMTVGVGWAPGIPAYPVLLDHGSVRDFERFGADPFDWPKDAELLEAPWVGLRIDFKPEKNLNGELQQHYWIYRQKGGVFFRVLRKDKAKFSLAEWIPKDVPVDRSKERLKELHDVVTRVKGSYVYPKLKIDPNGALEDMRKRLKRVEMTVGFGGVFSLDGEVVHEKDLEKRLSAVARKFQEEKEVPKIDIVVDLIVEKGVEFRFVEQAIKIAKKAGITEASFITLEDWKKWSEDE